MDTQARVGEIQKAAQLEIEKQRQETEKKAHADAQQEAWTSGILC